MKNEIPEIKVTTYGSKKSIIAMALENMKKNVIAGIECANFQGITCSMPDYIDVDMPIDSNGLPVTSNRCIEVARVKIRLRIRPNDE